MGGYSLSELGSIFVMQGFSGLSLFSVLLLMAIGLAIIFGQMGVINMAHGEFMTIGAYTTVMLSQVAAKYGFVSSTSYSRSFFHSLSLSPLVTSSNIS